MQKSKKRLPHKQASLQVSFGYLHSEGQGDSSSCWLHEGRWARPGPEACIPADTGTRWSCPRRNPCPSPGRFGRASDPDSAGARRLERKWEMVPNYHPASIPVQPVSQSQYISILTLVYLNLNPSTSKCRAQYIWIRRPVQLNLIPNISEYQSQYISILIPVYQNLSPSTSEY